MAAAADKKKKQQMIILAVLGVVVVVIAVMNLPGLFNQGGGSTPPPTTPGTQPGTPTPAPGTPVAGTPGTPGAPGAAKPEDDLAPIKTDAPVIQNVAYIPGAFDPLLVLNSDIVDERRAEEVVTLKANWILKGVASRLYELRDVDGQLVYDEDGRVKMVEVFEVFFDGKPYPYKVGDRLTGTRFKITEVRHDRDGAIATVTSDTGAVQRLKIASFDPYDEK
ncbi:MAG: hypothetical protein IT462_02550 [Planctomycetes bacterium]|nr:hypothetical protein [Planctomycetota bacterium]